MCYLGKEVGAALNPESAVAGRQMMQLGFIDWSAQIQQMTDNPELSAQMGNTLIPQGDAKRDRASHSTRVAIALTEIRSHILNQLSYQY